MNCPRCGIEVETVKFCPECGTALGEAVEATVLVQDGNGGAETVAAKPKKKRIWERHPALIALAIVLIMLGVVVVAFLIVTIMFGLAMSGG